MRAGGRGFGAPLGPVALALSLLASLLDTVPARSAAYDDATVLALELSGQLLAPPELTARIGADLDAIHAHTPYMATIHARPTWRIGELTVRLTDPAFEQFLDGTYHGLDELNARYGPVRVRSYISFVTSIVLEFDQPYQPEVLAGIYQGAEGVVYAYPATLVGDGNDIESSGVGNYLFTRGWGDCPAGCTSRHFWSFSVTDGQVTLVDEWGTPISTPTLPITWGAIQARYR